MKKLATLFVFLTIISCKNNPELTNKGAVEALNSQIVISENNKVILKSSDTNNIKRVQSIIINRKPLMKKIMPIFKKQLMIKIGEDEQVWLFSEPNYIKRKTKQDNQVYTVDPSFINLIK